MAEGEGYIVGTMIVAVPVFFGSWIYFTASYGFLGFCLGWIPAYFAAWIIGLSWPLLAVGAALLALFIFGT